MTGMGPYCGRSVGINAQMAGVELSYDIDWYRPKVSVSYGAGDAARTMKLLAASIPSSIMSILRGRVLVSLIARALGLPKRVARSSIGLVCFQIYEAARLRGSRVSSIPDSCC